MGEITRVWLYTAFDYPHTSCGCFEGVAFYIPEVDGLGIVHRGFKDVTVNGLPFSTLADSTAGGRQVDGFHGISIEYMRSPKFLQVDGGWNRIVWMPASVKERVKDFIPKEVVDKIATENDAKTVDELRTFLKAREHPVVQQWKEIPVEAAPEMEEEISAAPLTLPTAAIAAGGGFKIILKNAKIHAEKLIIKRTKEEKKKR
jgi:acetyl-CoA decarbonylase/synthase complex subunit beta